MNLDQSQVVTGHGHVIRNEDGSKAGCGGPALCTICKEELRIYKVAIRVEVAANAAKRIRIAQEQKWELDRSLTAEDIGKIIEAAMEEAGL